MDAYKQEFLKLLWFCLVNIDNGKDAEI
jgi:hypothetical protein